MTSTPAKRGKPGPKTPISEEYREHLRQAGRNAASRRRVLTGNEAQTLGMAFALLGMGEAGAARGLLEPIVHRHGLDRVVEQA